MMRLTPESDDCSCRAKLFVMSPGPIWHRHPCLFLSETHTRVLCTVQRRKDTRVAAHCLQLAARLQGGVVPERMPVYSKCSLTYSPHSTVMHVMHGTTVCTSHVPLNGPCIQCKPEQFGTMWIDLIDQSTIWIPDVHSPGRHLCFAPRQNASVKVCSEVMFQALHSVVPTEFGSLATTSSIKRVCKHGCSHREWTMGCKVPPGFSVRSCTCAHMLPMGKDGWDVSVGG